MAPKPPNRKPVTNISSTDGARPQANGSTPAGRPRRLPKSPSPDEDTNDLIDVIPSRSEVEAGGDAKRVRSHDE